MCSMDPLSQRPFIKSSSRLIKRLFDFPDPMETKKLVADMIESESTRLLSKWNFDPKIGFSAGSNDGNSARNVEFSPSSNNRRFTWHKQERHSIPQFYSRPFHSNRSKCKNSVHPYLCGVTSSITPIGKSNQLSVPLAERDVNVLKTDKSKRTPAKQTISFTSPPRLSSESVPPTLARFVSALRIPLQSSENAFESSSSRNSSIPSSPIASRSVAEVNSPVPSKLPASRQLFNDHASLKRARSSTPTRQPKITDLVPLRKTRTLVQKCRRLDAPEHSPSTTH